MERIKHMSLKKSFFTITALFLLIGVILGIVCFLECIILRDSLSVSGQITVDFGKTSADAAMQYTGSNQDFRVTALSILQIGLPILFIIISVLLAVLENGAERIQRQDLDFTVEVCANDELGTLCSAFETMRKELLKNNRELWRQMEERKRLNAAFSHDLRNPVTVLKGSAKLLQKKLEQGTLTIKSAGETIALITQYTGRVEDYVEAITGAQKLEELKCSPKLVSWTEFSNELKSGMSILSENTGKTLEFFCYGENRKIRVDRSVIQSTTENLVGNALRYAKSTVSVCLSYEQDRVVLTVSDDGPGFSPVILQKGATPFLRDDLTGNQEHFGMGLYVCRMLCEKHGGNLTLNNIADGAKAVADFCF